MFGKDTHSIDSLSQTSIDPWYNRKDIAKKIRYRLQVAYKQAKELLIRSKNQSIRQSEKGSKSISIKQGDKVILVQENIHKQELIYKGPFMVTKINHHNVEICDVNTAKTKVVHKNNLRKH